MLWNATTTNDAIKIELKSTLTRQSATVPFVVCLWTERCSRVTSHVDCMSDSNACGLKALYLHKHSCQHICCSRVKSNACPGPVKLLAEMSLLKSFRWLTVLCCCFLRVCVSLLSVCWHRILARHRTTHRDRERERERGRGRKLTGVAAILAIFSDQQADWGPADSEP